MKNKNKSFIVFWLLIIACSLLRIIKASVMPISYDEVFSFLHYASQNIRGIMSDYSFPNNHLLNSILMKYSVFLFGDSELAIRLPALIFGIFSCIMLYRISCLLIRGDLLRFLFLALSFTHPFILDLHIQARGYSIGMAFSLMGLYMLLNYYNSKYELNSKFKRLSVFVMMVLSFTLSIAAVPIYVNFVVSIWGCYYLMVLYKGFVIKDKKEFVKAAKLLFFVALPTIILSKLFYSGISLDPSKLPWGFGFLKDFIGDYARHVFFYGAVKSQGQNNIALIVAFVFVIVGWVYTVYKRDEKNMFVGFIVIGLVAVVICERLLIHTNYSPARTVFYTVPFIYIAMINSLEMFSTVKIKGRDMLNYMKYLVLIGLLVCNIFHISIFYWFTCEKGEDGAAAIKVSMKYLKEQDISVKTLSYPWYLGEAFDYYKKRYALEVTAVSNDRSDYSVLMKNELTEDCKIILSSPSYYLTKNYLSNNK